MSIDVRKVMTDAGYVTIGMGVLGYQQAQTRRRNLRGRLDAAGGCIDERAKDVRGRVEDQARAAVERVQELGGELGKRVEPLVDRLPEPVAKAVEPVRARVRALAGSAA